MKSKKTKTKSRSAKKTRKKSRSTHHPKTSKLSTNMDQSTIPSLTTSIAVKTCQELEVGDIGGFGSTAELEEHEKRCSEPATEFCTNCGRNLCHNHYDLLHRDHDTISGHTSGPTLA
ncbi:MAG TPA: hypothetical protein VFJ63_00855 [Candidatus Bathyarchaeia archaeon]|nr:hypothetical protein [Candidatus Bathyarchaeia archaeon]